MNKTFKKILVVLLSALMVLTYMPATALTAFAFQEDYEHTVTVIYPEEIGPQEWTGEDLDLSDVEELDTIYADVSTGERISRGVELTRGEDFTVKSNTNQKGEAWVVFTGINDYEGYDFLNNYPPDEPEEGEVIDDLRIKFWIIETPEDATYDIELDTSRLVYDGEKTTEEAEEYVERAVRATIIRNGNKKIRHYALDATAVDEDAKGNAGEEYLVDVVLGETVITDEPFSVTIAKRDLAKTRINAEFDEVEYNAKPQEPAIVGDAWFYNRQRPEQQPVVIPADDYTLTYSNNVNVEDVPVVTFTAKETSVNFTGEGTITDAFYIYPFDLDREGAVHLMDLDKTLTHEYDGEEYKPGLTVTAYFYNKDGGKIPAADYQVKYAESSINAGTYKVGIEVKKDENGQPVNGNLVGATDLLVDAYEITKFDVKDAVVTPIKPVPQETDLDSLEALLEYFTITVNGIEIPSENERDIIEVDAEDNPLPDKEYSFTLYGDGNFEGQKTVKYSSVVKPFADEYESTYHVTFNGEEQKPTEEQLLNEGDAIKAPEDKFADLTADNFDVVDTEYENNIHAGTAVATVIGKNRYVGQEAKVTFTIDQIPVNDGTYPTNWSPNNWASQQWSGGPNATTRTKTRYREKTVWQVESITGITDGTYCKGSILPATTVVLRQRTIRETQTITQTRHRQGQGPGAQWIIDSEQTWDEATSEETNRGWAAESTRKTLKATDFDFTVVATAFEASDVENESYLTEVEVIINNEDGNYTRNDVDSNAPLYYNPEGIVAHKVDLTKAEIVGTIPATLTQDMLEGRDGEALIKEYIDVYVDDVLLSDEAYTVTDIDAAKAGKPGEEIKFTLDRTDPTDTQIIGGNWASAKVEAVDIADFAELIQYEVTEFVAEDPYTYDGTEKKPDVEEVEIFEEAELYPLYPYVGGLEEGKDYELSYEDNVDATTDDIKAKVTFTGKGLFKGEATAEFEIAQANLADLTPNFFELYDDPAEYIEESDIYLDGVDSIEYKPGEVEDLSDELTLEVKEDESYEIDEDDYEIVTLFPEECPDYDEDEDHEPTSYIWYVVVATETSRNYRAGTVIPAYPVLRKQLKRGSNVKVTLATEDPVEYKEDEDQIIDDVYPTVEVTDVDPAYALEEYDDYELSLEGFEGLVYGEEGYKDPNLVVTFVGNYAGVAKVPVRIVADSETDFENLKLEPRSKSGLMYNGQEKYIKVHYVGKDDRNDPRRKGDTFDVIYTDEEGNESYIPPVNVGRYTATIRATEAYGGEEYDSLDFEITQAKLSDFEWKFVTEYLLTLGDVEYQAEYTEAPVIYILGEVEIDEFEVIAYDKEWDGESETGNATVALKADSNFRYDGTADLTFEWEKGRLSGEPRDYFMIPDQEYTGEKLEPTEILAKDGWDLDPSWVEIRYYEGNDEIAGKTAKAYVKVTVPEDAKYYAPETFEGYITFNIIEHEVTPEEAREDAEEAIHVADLVLEDEEMPESQKAKVEAAAQALEDVLNNPLATPDEIEDAVDDLYDAIFDAEEYKEAYEEAVGVGIVASVMLLTGDYNEDAVTALTTALNMLSEALADPSATAEDLEQATQILAKVIENAEATGKKAETMVSLADTKVVYNGKAPEMPTPTVLGSTGAVTYKYYADAEGKTELEAAPVDAGKYYAKACVAADANYRSAESHLAKVEITKASQKIKSVKPAKKTVKAGKSFKLKAKTTGDGTVKFKKTKGEKKIKVSKTGKVKVNKKLKAGKYTIKVKVTAKATTNYKSAKKTATIKITVK